MVQSCVALISTVAFYVPGETVLKTMTKPYLMLGDDCFIGKDDDDEGGSHVVQEGEGCVSLGMMMMMMMMKVTSERCRCQGEVSEVRKGTVRKRGENNVSTLMIGFLPPNATECHIIAVYHHTHTHTHTHTHAHTHRHTQTQYV